MRIRKREIPLSPTQVDLLRLFRSFRRAGVAYKREFLRVRRLMDEILREPHAPRDSGPLLR